MNFYEGSLALIYGYFYYWLNEEGRMATSQVSLFSSSSHNWFSFRPSQIIHHFSNRQLFLRISYPAVLPPGSFLHFISEKCSISLFQQKILDGYHVQWAIQVEYMLTHYIFKLACHLLKEKHSLEFRQLLFSSVVMFLNLWEKWLCTGVVYLLCY